MEKKLDWCLCPEMFFHLLRPYDGTSKRIEE
jgi:hypothetical protein